MYEDIDNDDYDDFCEIVDLQDPKSLQLLAGLVEAAMKSPLRGELLFMMMMMISILHDDDDDDNVGKLGEAPYAPPSIVTVASPPIHTLAMSDMFQFDTSHSI